MLWQEKKKLHNSFFNILFTSINQEYSSTTVVVGVVVAASFLLLLLLLFLSFGNNSLNVDICCISDLIAVNKESIDFYLNQKSKGRALAIVVGGANEVLTAHPRTYNICLKNRKGFIKAALRNGYVNLASGKKSSSTVSNSNNLLSAKQKKIVY